MKIKTILALVSGCLLAACADDAANNSRQSNQETVYPQTTIGISVSSIATNPFFQNMYRRFEENGRTHPELTLMLSSADNDQDKQNTQLEEMVKKGARALVINLANVPSGKEVLEYWCGRNIPVVYFNRSPGLKNLAACDSAYFVDSDMAQAGVMQGTQVLNAWQQHPRMDKNGDGIIQYAIIKGLPNHEGTEQRSKWAVGTMQTYPQLGRRTEKIFEDYGLFQGVKAEEIAEQWQQQPEFDRVEVILANNDTMALGILAVLQKSGKNIPIYSIDGSLAALKEMQAGRLAGTVFNDFIGQADASLRIAANLAEGKDPMTGVSGYLDHKTVIIPVRDINSDNLQQLIEIYK